jgi:phosphatidylserine/phosphatidylglycerophosphate/cardiolipin synthase-like enzyme
MSAAALVSRFDAAVGDRVERAICAHHWRRLRRRGHARAFDPPSGGWAENGAFAPRAGSRVEFLVDGAEVLPRMVEDIRAATSHVELAGWVFTPSFRMGEGGPTLRELLAEAAQRVDVRVLAWAGAPLPLFRPDRRLVRKLRDALTHGTRVEMHLDAKERPMHCHHEKLVLVDDRVAYVGGIDLTDLSGNRCDTSAHEPRPGIGWHDASFRLEGPIVADVAEHFRLRWPKPLPPPQHQPGLDGGREAQLVRTVPEHVYDGLPQGEFTILESYVRALRAAERLVYLESQFLWSPELIEVLADRLRNPPHPDFRVLILLPAKPNSGRDDTRGQLGVLVDAAKKGGDDRRFLACTLFQPRGRIVYVHAKIGIVDDAWMTVGSANLNEHSLFNDTEVNVVVRDEAFIRRARLRLWEEHLEQPADGEPCRIVDELWRPLAHESAEDRKLRLLHGVSRRTRALMGPINGLLVDG